MAGFAVFAFFSCSKSSDSSNTLFGNYTLVKNKIHIQQNGNDYYDSLTANLGYLNLRSNDTAYVKSTWGYNTTNPSKILIDTPRLIIDSFKYSISGNIVSFYKNNVVFTTTTVTNNQFIIHQVFSTSPVNEAWNYFSK